jgi:branched-chain amino acid transport system ATP-binding protein
MRNGEDPGVHPGLVAAELDVDRVAAGFGEALILHEVSLAVRPGELVALLGPSGAGKTTLLRAITGLLPIRTGRIRLGAARLDGLRPHRIAALGVATLPEGRRLFDELSVGENLAMGAYLPDARRRAPAAQALVDGLFPALVDRRHAAVRELSAGEQQMVALGRALMASPRCLVLDDPFLGLAPPLRARLAPVLRELADGQGLAILAAGQHVRTLLRAAHRAYVLDAGRVLVAGAGPELLDDPVVRRTLLDLGREAPA